MFQDTQFPQTPLKSMDSLQLRLELINAIRNYEDYDNAMVQSALQIATHLHRNQTRLYRDNMPRTPYIEHPIRVALRIKRWGYATPTSLTSALLHDVPEDCAAEAAEMWRLTDQKLNPVELTLDAVGNIYGPHVGQNVRWLTNDPNVSYQQHYLDLLENASNDTVLIKAADTMDNAGSLPHQFGHVPDNMIAKLSKKYLEVLPDIAEALDKRKLYVPAQDIHRTEEKLQILQPKVQEKMTQKRSQS